MDLNRKAKPKLQLKLNVKLDQISPEQQHTVSVSAKKLNTDLFFSEPIGEGIDLSDYARAFRLDTRHVADVCIKKGGRKSQQDRFSGIPRLASDENLRFFYGVFDGHGGSLISSILEKQLHVYLQQSEHFRNNLEEAITTSFKALNEKIFEIQEDKKVNCGSTALCVLNNAEDLYVVNLGDSGCVLIKSDYTHEKLNREHKLTSQSELTRVEQLCTILDRQQTPRINGEIAVTRSFGDKKHSPYGLIAVPEIIKRRATANDRYLILATDGFWDIFDPSELATLVKQWDDRHSQSSQMQQLSAFLLDKAVEKTTTFKKDNMTLLAIDVVSQMSDFLKAEESNQDTKAT